MIIQKLYSINKLNLLFNHEGGNKMVDLGEENKVSGAFGGVELGNIGTEQNAGTIRTTGKGSNLPTKAGFWNKFKAFWLQEIDWNKEIKVELTPYQQKVEDEINEFLHQEITWEKVHDFLFQEISFGKNKQQG